jgi:probable DNA metabolism protein
MQALRERDNTNLVYIYDGTLEGFLCCVYESYIRKEIPSNIRTEDDIGQPQLMEELEWIRTDMAHAGKIYESIDRKIALEAQDFIREAYLTCLDNKEILMYRFISQGYQYGRAVMDRLTDETVGTLIKAVRNLTREAHNFKGFIRFTIYDGVMVSCISPKNRVLPLLSDHFANRYPDETFLIYDRTHQMAVVHKPEGTLLTAMHHLALPPIDDAEKAYHALWRCFQKTIAIEERTNPKCQMNHMPKRYWADMTEFEN